MTTSPCIDSQYNAISTEVVRALRGSQSQRAASMRLGYSTNVFYAWERGQRSPKAVEILRLIALQDRDLAGAMTRLTRRPAPWMAQTPDAGWVQRLLVLLRGQMTYRELSLRTGVSRCTLSRWFNGHTPPRWPDLLAIIEATTLRCLDFLEDVVGIAALPSAHSAWEELEARRQIAWSMPWTQGILRALELEDYRKTPAHLPGWISDRLGLTREEEERGLDALERARLVVRHGNHLVVTERTVDTGRPAPPGTKTAVKHHWHRVAEQHLLGGAEGYFSYNLFSVSSADLVRLKHNHVAYFEEMRRIVAASEPAEHVMLLQLQMFELGTGSVREPGAPL